MHTSGLCRRPEAALAMIDDFIDPVEMPPRYAMLTETTFCRRAIEAGSALLVDRLAPPTIGDVVLVYFRPGANAVRRGLPLRLVAELATSSDFGALGASRRGNCRPVIGVYLDEGCEATFVAVGDVLAVHKVVASQRDLLTPARAASLARGQLELSAARWATH